MYIHLYSTCQKNVYILYLQYDCSTELTILYSNVALKWYDCV